MKKLAEKWQKKILVIVAGLLGITAMLGVYGIAEIVKLEHHTENVRHYDLGTIELANNSLMQLRDLHLSLKHIISNLDQVKINEAWMIFSERFIALEQSRKDLANRLILTESADKINEFNVSWNETLDKLYELINMADREGSVRSMQHYTKYAPIFANSENILTHYIMASANDGQSQLAMSLSLEQGVRKLLLVIVSIALIASVLIGVFLFYFCGWHLWVH